MWPYIDSKVCILWIKICFYKKITGLLKIYVVVTYLEWNRLE